MPTLVTGILLWSAVHLMPAVSPDFRRTLVSKLGEKPYKVLFALVIVASVVLIVIGWRGSLPLPVYQPPAWGRPVAIALMIVAVYLFGAARRPAAVKRFVRNPQLTGLVVWAIAHLLANGDRRSLVLFGCLGAWAIVEKLAINRRDGEWIRPAPPPLARELLGIAITLAVFALLAWAHPWFTGVAVMPR